MEVILLERVANLGQMGQTVNVKPGYARNFLIPQKKALRATDDNRKLFESKRVHLEALNLTRKTEAEEVAKTLNGLMVELIRQAGDTGQLYGSVSSRDVVDAVDAAGVSIEKRSVELDSPIKTLGLHAVKVVLHPEVVVTVTVNVARSTDEAKVQARGGTVNPYADDDDEEEEIIEEEDAA